MGADENRDKAGIMRSVVASGQEPVILHNRRPKRVTAEVDGSRGSESYNKVNPLKKTSTTESDERRDVLSSSLMPIGVQAMQELSLTSSTHSSSYSPDSSIFDVVKNEPTFLPHYRPSEYSQLQLTDFNREAVRHNMMIDAELEEEMRKQTEELKEEPEDETETTIDTSEKENIAKLVEITKTEEKRREEEFVSKFIAAAKQMHPLEMPKHDFFSLCDRQLWELARSFRNNTRRVNQKSGRDGESGKFLKLCEDIVDACTDITKKDDKEEILRELREVGCIKVPRTADGRVQVQHWTTDDRIKKIYPQNMIYILFNPFVQYLKETDYSKPCQIFSRYCEDDGHDDEKGKKSYFCFNPLHYYPQLTRQQFQHDLSKIIEKMNPKEFKRANFNKDLDKWGRTIYSLFLCGPNSSANSFVDAVASHMNLQEEEKNLTEIESKMDQISISRKQLLAKESILYQINLSSCKRGSRMFGECCYIKFPPAHKGKNADIHIAEIRLTIVQFFRPDILQDEKVVKNTVNEKWAKCDEKSMARYCINPNHCTVFMDNKTADKDPNCPDLKDIETNDQTLNKAATWGVISFVRFTDKKSETESMESRAFIHSNFYCYFPWSGDILSDNLKMAKEKTSPEEWKEDKEFPLVFSRIKIKPASCNQDDEKNYDPCKKVKDQFSYSSKFNLMKKDFDDYARKYCLKSSKEDPSHEYCIRPSRMPRHCSHSYKENMNTISQYLKKISRKDDYDLELNMRVANDENQFKELRDGIELNYSVWLKNHGRRSVYVSLSIENRFELSEKLYTGSSREVGEILLDPMAVLFMKIPDSKSARVLFHYSGGPHHDRFKRTVEIMHKDKQVLFNPATMTANPDHLSSVYIVYKWNHAKKEVFPPASETDSTTDNDPSWVPKNGKDANKEFDARKDKFPRKSKKVFGRDSKRGREGAKEKEATKEKEKKERAAKKVKVKKEDQVPKKHYEEEGLLNFDTFKIRLSDGTEMDIFRLEKNCNLNNLEYLQVVSSPKEYAVNQFRNGPLSKTNSD